MSYIGQGLPADVFAGFTIDKFTGTGVASQALTLTKAPLGETALLITIDGVVQEPTDDFTVLGTTVTIVGTAPLNSEINVTHLSGTVPNTLASAVDVNGLSDGIILDADADTTISADTDDQIDFKTGGTDRMHIASDGDVLISKTSNAYQTTGHEFLDGGRAFHTADGGKALSLVRNSSNGAIMDFYNSSGSEVGSIETAASGIGIKLGGTASANLLDDYEEGTWTPAIANVTTSAVTGKYTKIGRHVSLHLYMAISGGTLNSTTIQITGVPFANGDHEATGSIMYNQIDHGADYQIMPYLNQGTSAIRIYQSKDATGWSTLATQNLSSSSSFFISLVYES